MLKHLDTLKTTDMALIVSHGQNEIQQMQKYGRDIVPHRQRMNDEALDEKFKDTGDPLRLVFVCATWRTVSTHRAVPPCISTSRCAITP